MDFPAESYFQPAGSRAESQPLRFPCAAIGLIFAFVDAGAIVLASFVGAGGYQLLVLGTAWNLDFHIGAGITAALLYLLIGKSSGFYQVSDILSSRRETSQILWQWVLTSLSLALLAFLFRMGIQFSRVSIIGFAILALPLLFASRNLMKTAVTSALRRNRVQSAALTGELSAIENAIAIPTDFHTSFLRKLLKAINATGVGNHL